MGLAGTPALYTRQLAGTTHLAKPGWGQGEMPQRVVGRVVEAGGTPKVKPSTQPPGAELPGAEGVADRTGGHTSPTEGSHPEAPQLGLCQHPLVRLPELQAQVRSQPQGGRWCKEEGQQ